VDAVLKNAAAVNPSARVYVTNSEISLDRPELVRGKKVVLVEDGPTLTHGGERCGCRQRRGRALPPCLHSWCAQINPLPPRPPARRDGVRRRLFRGEQVRRR